MQQTSLGNKSIQKQFIELLSSMRFAVSMLTILGIASIIGTVLKQNEPYTNYIIKFGQFWFDAFETLGLYDVYHASWFLLILLFLVISTSLCVYRNTPLMLKEWRTYKAEATEKSLHNFSHRAEYTNTQPHSADLLARFLTARGFKFKTVTQTNGDTLLAAKAGTHQRLGYMFTHAAIVIISIGGLLDGNLPFKIQEMLGVKVIENRDVVESEVPAKSRMDWSNLSFRANMQLPEGASSDVAFIRIKDGYLVQDLPFSIGLKTFKIEHYATGQPKSFESDIVINDPELKTPITTKIRVNHPFTYKGVTIYQSDFQDGGTGLTVDMWDIFSTETRPALVEAKIFDEVKIGEQSNRLTAEFNDFRLFNILNLSPDGKGKPKNVGPNFTYKLRDSQGQAKEYISYMQPLRIDGHSYYISGMRETVQDEYKYLRIPLDDDMELASFMRYKSTLFDESLHAEIAKRTAKVALTDKQYNSEMRQNFEISAQQLLNTFRLGGYTELAKFIEKTVPKAERTSAAQTYIKIIQTAAFETYQLSRERANLPLAELNENSQLFVTDGLNAMSDLFFYGAPYYLQLSDFKQRQASGLQLTRSPGQAIVYIGSALLTLGIFAMLYIRERRIWLLVKPNSVLFGMSANRKNRDFEIEFEQTKADLGQIVSAQKTV